MKRLVKEPTRLILVSTAAVAVGLALALGPLHTLAQAPCTKNPRLPYCFDAGQPAQASQVNANFDTVVGHAVPIGGIIMWSGSIGGIPSGWALCNGSNGTPDLRDRFVVGAGNGYSVGNTGGAASVALTTAQLASHNHTVSVTVNSGGNHYHNIKVDTGGGGGCGTQSGNMMHNSDTISGAICNQEARTTTNGSHSHTTTASSGNTGSGNAHENLPPYYALAYIMRTE